jgi:uncharacterized membrane protein YkoI
MRTLIAIAIFGAVSASAPQVSAQNHSHQLTYDSVSTMQRMPAELGRLNIEMKVAENVAMTSRISGDSALALAVARVVEGAKVNSAKMTLKHGNLVYDISVVPSGKKTLRKIYVDALTGNITEDKQLGGLNGTTKKRQAHTKEKNAGKEAAAAADTARKP